MVLCPRFHFYEINDQWWWPQLLREKVQDYLTLVWKLRAPILQKQSPAKLVASTLSRVLGDSVSEYAYVDFASGAGGPTPLIERALNKQIAARNDGTEAVKFVLTDLKPHPEAWKALTKKSDNLSYVAQGVDAANAPSDLLRNVEGLQGKKVMRLFSLAFHHFDDDLAARILDNTAETADGFCIFELQSRTFGSLITCFLLGPLTFLNTAMVFWRSPAHLFFTYIIPLIPFCLVFDGYISSFRTRTPEEVQQLMNRSGRYKGWKFLSGREMHTFPTGYMSWIICVRE